MRFKRRASWLITACGAMSLAGVVLAAATIITLTTEPLTVADALSERNLSALVRAVARTLGEAVVLLVRWL